MTTTSTAPRSLPDDVAQHASGFTERDLHLGYLIPPGHTLDTAVADGLLEPHQVDMALAVVRELAGQTIEDTVSGLLSRAYAVATRKAPSEQWLAGLEERYGLNGVPGTLEAAGQFVGVTRERVRQVCAKIEPLLVGSYVPALLPALEVVTEQSPVPEPVGQVLAPLGLSRPTFSGRTLLRIVELLGPDLEKLVGTELKLKSGWLVDVRESLVTTAVRVATKHTSKYGMTTVENIRQELSTPQAPADARDVEVVLRADASVRWAGDWLWVAKDLNSEHHNTMVNTFRHVLSVISPQTVTSLHEGLRRNQKFRQRDVVPPPAAIREFLAATPQFRVDGDLVEHVEPLDHHVELGATTAKMVDILLASTHKVMDRASLMEAWDNAGIAPGTAGVWTTYAEWIDSPAPNVWGLRGANPSPAVVAEIQADARVRRDLEPHRARWSWTARGTIEITVDVSTAVRQTGTVNLPTLGQTVGQQRLNLYVDGNPAGELKISGDHTWVWGWGPALRAAGATVGQVVRVDLDIDAGTAVLQLGGRELWST